MRPDGFVRLLHAEWTKFRTVRGWVIGMVVAAMVTVLVGLLGPAGSSFSCVGPNGQPCANRTPPTGPGGEPVTDRFYFVHQPMTGDGNITVQVTGLTGEAVQPWSKGGIMLKESLTPGSSYAAMMITGGHGVRMQHNYVHDTAGMPGTGPRWLRLTRAGDTVTGDESADGKTWNTVSTVTLAGLPSTVQAGLFATSPDYVVTTETLGSADTSGSGTVVTAGFDHVSLRGPWTGDGLGGQPDDGFQQTGNRFTVTGSGDVGPMVTDRGSTAKTIENGLVGGFAGLIAIIVVAALFITAEYRRGLIRTTLAANPGRGRVLAAKSVVIGAVTFVTGLVAAVVAIPLVAQLERAKGLYVIPATTLTEVRVIAGTAALLAVAAVLALAVGTILRRSAGAVTAVIVAIVLPYILAIASVLPSEASDWLLRVTPAAGFSIMQSMTEYSQVTATYTAVDGYFPLSPWGGFAVLCGYTVVALGVATYMLRRRDA